MNNISTASVIEAEITKATGTARKTAEAMEDYLNRVLNGAEALSDSEWDALSTPTQRWFNTAIVASDEGKPLPRFTDVIDSDEVSGTEPIEPTEPEPVAEKASADEDEDGEDEDEGEDDGDDGGVLKASSVSEGKKLSAQRTSMREALKRLIVRDPMASVSELQRQLDQAGFKVVKPAISAVKSETRMTLRILIDEGVLKDFELNHSARPRRCE
jgi:hypothetical protein